MSCAVIAACEAIYRKYWQDHKRNCIRSMVLSGSYKNLTHWRAYLWPINVVFMVGKTPAEKMAFCVPGRERIWEYYTELISHSLTEKLHVKFLVYV